MTYKKEIDHALKAIEKKEADSGEIYICRIFKGSAAVHNGKALNVQKSGVMGMAVRVIDNGKTGFSYTSDFSAAGIEEAVDNAVRLSAFTRRDASFAFAPAGLELPDMEQKYEDLDKVSVQDKMDMARAIEKHARDYDERVCKFRETSYEESWGSIRLANTEGFDEQYRFSILYGITQAIAESGGDRQIGMEVDYAFGFDGLDPRKIGEGAAKIAVGKLNAGGFRTAKTDVILNNVVTAGLMSVLSSAFSAENVLKSRSMFEGKMGEKVGSELVTVIDDGTHEKGPSTMLFDGEGMPSRRTVLIEKGVLKSYLHNIYTAGKMDEDSTGNMVRGGFNSPPGLASTNIFLEPGNTGLDGLMKEMGGGILIDEVMGLHTMDTVSGEFSLGASGKTVKNGKITGAVQGMAVAGNIFDLLGSIKMVGGDFRFMLGGSGGPSVLVEGMSVSGE